MELSDEALAIFVPILVYWVYSGMYMALGQCQSMDKYRLHSRREEDPKNLVSKRDAAKIVLLQQLVQASLAAVVLTVQGNMMSRPTTAASSAISESSTTTKQLQLQAGRWWSPSSLLMLALQFAVAMVVLDLWQYVWHRILHQNPFLYRHIHSWHHRNVVPYAFGTLYNHPAEGLVIDTIGGLLAMVASGMSPRASIFFFSFVMIKGVDDHCGLMLPWNPLHRCFRNNTAYHDMHHALSGAKYNFAQPFFVTWDKVFGTHVPYVIEKRPGGGLQARPIINGSSNKQN